MQRPEHQATVSAWAAVIAACPIAQAVVDQSGDVIATNAAWRCGVGSQLPTSWTGMAIAAAAGQTIETAQDGRKATLAPLAEGLALVTVLDSSRDKGSELRELEERLRLSESRLRAALAAARLGTWSWDIARGTIVWDESLRAVVGLGADDPTPDPATFGQWIHPDDRARVGAQLQEALAGTSEYDVLFRLRHCDGRWHWHKSRGQVERRDGVAVSMVGACIDLNDVKTTEQELARKAAELERSNEELEQFAYIASHDLQEPLRMITSYLGILQRRYTALFDDQARQYFAYAIGGAERMRDLIRAVLEFSHAGSGPLVQDSVSCADALADALAILKPKLRSSQAAVDAEDLPTVRGNRLQLSRVFQNLISNAIKFRRDEPLRVRVAARDSAEGWVISISDNGIGIPADDHQRLFRIFQRLHAVDRFPGSGIGLATCKKIIERHGGRIWVESKPAEGSTFSFVLPR